MTHIITSLCLRDGGCVTVCPVECIVPGKPVARLEINYGSYSPDANNSEAGLIAAMTYVTNGYNGIQIDSGSATLYLLPCLVGFLAAQGTLAVANPGVNFAGNRRINSCDCDGDMADLKVGQFVNVRSDTKPVCRQAQHHLRILGADQPECLHGLLRIGKGIPRSGDADDADFGLPLQDKGRTRHLSHNCRTRQNSTVRRKSEALDAQIS